MISKKYSGFFLLITTVLFTQCRPDVSIEREQISTGGSADTMSVTSFDVERENTLRPADWQAYESGSEIIVAPSDWVSHLIGMSLIIMPPSDADSSEQLVFSRYSQDSPTLNYDKFAQQLASKSFKTYQIFKGDELKKVELSQNYFYEHTAELSKNKLLYTGYNMAYIGDSLIYNYTIILSKTRLKADKGDIIRDMIGNFQINHKYVISNINPIKRIIYLKK